jgi:hypothetical protein
MPRDHLTLSPAQAQIRKPWRRFQINNAVMDGEAVVLGPPGALGTPEAIPIMDQVLAKPISRHGDENASQFAQLAGVGKT